MNAREFDFVAGSAFREWRLAHCITRAAVARAVGLSETRIWHIERGRNNHGRAGCGPETRARLAKAVGVDVAAIWPSAPEVGGGLAPETTHTP